MLEGTGAETSGKSRGQACWVLKSYLFNHDQVLISIGAKLLFLLLLSLVLLMLVGFVFSFLQGNDIVVAAYITLVHTALVIGIYIHNHTRTERTFGRGSWYGSGI
jgi:hypothetical protein